VKLVAVDSTAHQSVGGQYGVKGFPTIKIFGADKKSPKDYNGARTADAIVSAMLKEARALVNKRMGKKAGSSSRGSGSSGGRAKGSSEPGGGKHVVTLDALTFDAKVFGSDRPVLVEFYAPWCGHCKTLAPEWASAAETLAGEVTVAAVDATSSEQLAARFGIRGFPTIKFFPAGASADSDAQDYNGGRDAAGIAQFALSKLEAMPASGPEELVSADVFDSKCGGKRICVVAFLPHITTEGKEAREGRIAALAEAAKTSKAPSFRFLWTSEAQQPAMEAAFGVRGNLPAVVAVSTSKKAFAVHRGTADADGIAGFVRGLVSGRVRTSKSGTELPKVATVAPWDGEDAEEEEDDLDLAELLGDEL